ESRNCQHARARRAHRARSTICLLICILFFFNDTATTEIYTLSLHDALPILFTPGLPFGFPKILLSFGVLTPYLLCRLKSCFTFVFVPFFPLFPWLWLFPIKLHLPHVSVSPEVPDSFTDTHQRTSVNLWCKMHSNHQNTSYFTHCHNQSICSLPLNYVITQCTVNSKQQTT